MRTEGSEANLAYVASESEIQTMKCEAMLSISSTEKMGRKRVGSAWKIVHIHCSSRKKWAIVRFEGGCVDGENTTFAAGLSAKRNGAISPCSVRINLTLLQALKTQIAAILALSRAPLTLI